MEKASLLLRYSDEDIKYFSEIAIYIEFQVFNLSRKN